MFVSRQSADETFVRGTTSFRGNYADKQKPDLTTVPSWIGALRNECVPRRAQEDNVFSQSPIIGRRKAILAAAMMLGMITAAQAYTPEQEQLCTGDAMRLCSSEIPDVDRVTACMIRHKSELSAGCKSVFGPTNATPVKASKPLNLTPQRFKS